MDAGRLGIPTLSDATAVATTEPVDAAVAGGRARTASSASFFESDEEGDGDELEDEVGQGSIFPSPMALATASTQRCSTCLQI